MFFVCLLVCLFVICFCWAKGIGCLLFVCFCRLCVNLIVYLFPLICILFVFVLERPVKDIGCLLSCLGCMFVYFLCFFVCFCFCDQSKTSVAFSFIFVKIPLSSSPSLSLLDDFTEKNKKNLHVPPQKRKYNKILNLFFLLLLHCCFNLIVDQRFKRAIGKKTTPGFGQEHHI